MATKVTVDASVAIYDWVNPSEDDEPFGRGGAAILDDGTILICTQIEEEDIVANWRYEVRHYTRDLTLLGMADTGNLPFESFWSYFVPIGGQDALLMMGAYDDDPGRYYVSVVSGAGNDPVFGEYQERISGIESGLFNWGGNGSRCQFVDSWNCIVRGDGRRAVYVMDTAGVELAFFFTDYPDEYIGETLTWNQRGNNLYFCVYSQNADYYLTEYVLTNTGGSFSFSRVGDRMPVALTAPGNSAGLWGLALGDTSEEPRSVSWYGEYMRGPGPDAGTQRFRWFVVADAVTGEELAKQDMVYFGDMDADFNRVLTLYPVEDFYSAVNPTPNTTLIAGQLGGDNWIDGVHNMGEYPAFAIHIIGIDAADGTQTFYPLKAPGTHGEQDTLFDGSVTLCVRKGRWVVTCCTVNLDDYSGHTFYSFFAWTGTAGALAPLSVYNDKLEWAKIGDENREEPGRLKIKTPLGWAMEYRAKDGPEKDFTLRPLKMWNGEEWKVVARMIDPS